MKKGIFVAVALLSGICLGALIIARLSSLHVSTIAPPPKTPTAIYQWHDKDGKLYMSNERPPNGVEYTVISVDGSLSRMDPPPAPAESTAPAKPGNGSVNPLSVYTPSGAKQLIDDARNAARIKEQRQQEMIDRIEKNQ